MDGKCCENVKEHLKKLTPEMKVIGAGVLGLLSGMLIGLIAVRRKK